MYPDHIYIEEPSTFGRVSRSGVGRSRSGAPACKTGSFKMRPICWACCGVLAALIAAIVAFIVWTVAVASPLWKAEDTGSAKFMLPSCKLQPVQVFINPTAAYLHGRCIGTLESILFMDVLARQEPSLCTKIPAGTTPVQIRDVIMKYAQEHPDQTSNDFRRFAYSALHEAWPCK
jgi:hypothetical protein